MTPQEAQSLADLKAEMARKWQDLVNSMEFIEYAIRRKKDRRQK